MKRTASSKFSYGKQCNGNTELDKISTVALLILRESDAVDVFSIGIYPEKLVKIKLWFKDATFLTHREYLNRNIPTFVIRDVNIKMLNKVIYLHLLQLLIVLLKNYLTLLTVFINICVL